MPEFQRCNWVLYECKMVSMSWIEDHEYEVICHSKYISFNNIIVITMMNGSHRYMKIRLILEVFVGRDDKASQDDYDEVIPKC